MASPKLWLFWMFNFWLVFDCTGQCKEEEVIFTGDGKSLWNVEVNGEQKQDLLHPRMKPFLVSRDMTKLEIIITPACGPVRLQKVTLQTKLFNEIKILSKEQIIPDNELKWVKTSFKFQEKLVDKITIRLSTNQHEGGVRNIFIKACIVPAPKTLEEEFAEILVDMQKIWAVGDIDKFAATAFTDDIIQVAQAKGIIRGKNQVKKEYLADLVPGRQIGERTVIDAALLSETRAYTIVEAKFYTDETKTKIIKPVMWLFILWKKENNKWLIDRMAQLNDGSVCD